MFSYWFLLSFVVTIITAEYWPWFPRTEWLMLLFVVAMTSIKYRALRFTVGALFGVSLILWQGNLLKNQSDYLFESGKNTTINASVVSLFKQNRHGFESVIIVRSIEEQKNTSFRRGKVRLFTPFPLKLGDNVTLNVVFKPIYGKLNTAGFDKERYLFSQGIIAEALYVKSSSYSIHTAFNWRQYLFESVNKAIVDLEHAGLIRALAFGYRSDIHTDTWDGLKASGLIHLIAISGLHIGMAYGIGYWLGGVGKLVEPRLIWAPIIMALCSAMFYAWLAGFSLPTKRALLMCFIATMMIVKSVHISKPRFLVIGLACVLSVDPFSPMSMSFWMSFGALIVVLYCVSRLELTSNTWKQKVLFAVKVQALINVLLMPVTAYFFSGVSAVSIVYNLLFLPLFTFIVIPLLFFSIFSTILLPAFSELSWWVVDKTLAFVLWSSELSEYFWVEMNQDGIALLCLIVLFILLTNFVQGRFSIAMFGFVSIWALVKPTNPNLEIDVLDVGHGLAVLLTKDGKSILYDTGGAWEGGSVVETIIKPVMLHKGVSTLDGLIISHFDLDHAGGFADALVNLNPTWIKSSKLDSGHLPCIAGVSWNWQSIEFEALWPPKLSNRPYNPQSCVIRARDKSNQFSLLLTGDIDALSEWLLIRQPNVLASDVMIVPHHGSKTSSTQRFISAVEPSIAIASLDKGNQWGMPHREVLSRYADNGTEWLDTGGSGQITIKVTGAGWSFATLREDTGAPWYRQMLRKRVE